MSHSLRRNVEQVLGNDIAILAVCLGCCVEQAIAPSDAYAQWMPLQNSTSLQGVDLVAFALAPLPALTEPSQNPAEILTCRSYDVGELPAPQEWARDMRQRLQEFERIQRSRQGQLTEIESSDVTAERVQQIDRQIRNALNALGSRVDWYHLPDEPRPDEFEYGPLQGQKKQLAHWIRRGGPRSLESAGRGNHFWITLEGRTAYSVWFRNQRQYEHAEQTRVEEEQGRSKE